MKWIALLLVLGLTSCDGGTPLPGAPLGWGPASGTLYGARGDIVGDWFYCEDQGCAAYRSEGLRFERDGTLGGLMAFGESYVPGQNYCFWEGSFSYSWDGSTLTLRGADGNDVSLSCRLTGIGAAETLDCEDGGRTLRRATGPAPEPCSEYGGLPPG